ncbi:MAG: DUF6402 family protein [Azoarcus sp.]|jgi:hypothetical protein|nr:DUF6402 family protein [Azoarcus sp.]
MFWGKPKPLKPHKVPYAYPTDSVLFGGAKWKYVPYEEGAMPLLTEQTVSLDGGEWGEVQPPKAPPPPTLSELEKIPPEKITHKQFLQLSELLAAEKKAETAEQDKAKKEAEDIANGVRPEGIEVKQELPVFDLQDIVLAMEAMGWPIAAKIIKRWFEQPAYKWEYIRNPYPNPNGPRYLDDPRRSHPVDSTSITLDWVLKFGNNKKKVNELINVSIHDAQPRLRNLIKQKCEDQIKKQLEEDPRKLKMLKGFTTSSELGDLQAFHRAWQVTYINNADYLATSKPLKPDELTAIAGNFAFYVAIGAVQVTAPKNLVYDNERRLKRWCYEPTIHLTHIYVYFMDFYNFTDHPEEMKSQYLGHWNKYGVIITVLGGFSEFDRKYLGLFRGHLGDAPVERRVPSIDLPVSVRGERVVYSTKAVYWPVFNSTFDAWRARHKRGQDCVIFTQPKLYKLKKPIVWRAENVHGEWEGIHENNI